MTDWIDEMGLPELQEVALRRWLRECTASPSCSVQDAGDYTEEEERRRGRAQAGWRAFLDGIGVDRDEAEFWEAREYTEKHRRHTWEGFREFLSEIGADADAAE